MQLQWLAIEEESPSAAAAPPDPVPLQGNGTASGGSGGAVGWLTNGSDYLGTPDWRGPLVSNVTQAVVRGTADLALADEESVMVDLRIHHPALAVLLAFFCVATVFGNVLVMVAVAREPYLHTVTNYFVCSLATADCLVGAVVMPFSAVHEVMDQYWVFGQDWCDIWHSVDVLASTGSILNLCVISLDRYWAITDPIAYPGRMTRSRARGTSCFLTFPLAHTPHTDHQSNSHKTICLRCSLKK